MNIAWTLNPRLWRLGRYETFDVHPLTGREIHLAVWWCLGPICIAFTEDDQFRQD